MKVSFLAAIFVFSASAFAVTDLPSQVFDLKKSIQFAIEHSPAFDTLKRQVSIAEFEKKSASARFLPSLDLSATHGLQDSSPRTSGPWGSELRLDLVENFYDNGVTQTNYEIAVFKRKQAELIFQEKSNRISLDIVTQFLIYSLNVKLLEIQDKQVKLVNKQYNLISKDYYQGIKTKNDFLRFKTQVSRYEIDLVNSKNAVEKSKQELQRLIGVELLTQSNIDFVPFALGTIEEFFPESSLRIEDHLQYKVAEVQKEINKLDYDLVRKKNLPEWFVSSGVSYGSSQYLGKGQSFTQNDQLSWNALLTVKYNFFDWGVRSNDRQIAAEKNIVLDNGLKSDLLILKSDLNQFIINISQVKRNYGLAKELLSLEKNNIDFVEVEYRNGKIQYLDLITGLNNLTDAQIRFYSAASDLQSLKFTSLYHQGKLYEELIK
jgi:outer membrane protein TolC